MEGPNKMEKDQEEGQDPFAEAPEQEEVSPGLRRFLESQKAEAGHDPPQTKENKAADPRLAVKS